MDSLIISIKISEKNFHGVNGHGVNYHGVNCPWGQLPVGSTAMGSTVMTPALRAPIAESDESSEMPHQKSPLSASGGQRAVTAEHGNTKSDDYAPVLLHTHTDADTGACISS